MTQPVLVPLELTQTQFAQIARHAEAHKLTISQYVVDAALDRLPQQDQKRGALA